MNPGTEGKFFIFHCASSVREAKNLCIVAHTRVAHNVWGTPAVPWVFSVQFDRCNLFAPGGPAIYGLERYQCRYEGYGFQAVYLEIGVYKSEILGRE